MHAVFGGVRIGNVPVFVSPITACRPISKKQHLPEVLREVSWPGLSLGTEV